MPPATAGACDPARDGWLVKPTRTIYRNRSSALDPPTCTPGSAAGLNRLEYRPCGDRDLAMRVNVKQATLAAPLGSLRATLVLGSTSAAGDAGWCAPSAPLACSASGSSGRCH